MHQGLIKNIMQYGNSLHYCIKKVNVMLCTLLSMLQKYPYGYHIFWTIRRCIKIESLAVHFWYIRCIKWSKTL